MARVLVIGVAVLVVGAAFWASNRVRDAMLGDGGDVVAASTEPPVPGSPAPTADLAPDPAVDNPPVDPPAEPFSDCAAAKAAGVSLIPSSDPRYVVEQDPDRDGVACDRHGDPPTPKPTPARLTSPPVCLPR